MARTLRPRTSRPSYALTAIVDDEDEGQNAAGPSRIPVDDDASSESDFTPEVGSTSTRKARRSQAVDEKDDDDDDELTEDGFEEEVISIPKRSASTAKSKSKPKKKSASKPQAMISVVKSTNSNPTTLSGSFRRQMYVLPTPSVHHRHRAVPLYSVPGRVERLVSAPVLFSSPAVALTNNFTLNAKLIDRMNKSWGYNVGPGPLWELVEDRGWFKEAGDQMESERNRRPKVHQGVPVLRGWKVLDAEQAAMYLPTDDVTTEDGTFKPPPPIPCSFGPVGSQSRKETQMLHAFKMADLIPGSSAHVLNAGAPVWGLDWCPTHPDDREEFGNVHYLAVAPFPSPSHSPEIGVRVSRPSNACIQIWSFGPDTTESPPSPSRLPETSTSTRKGEGKDETIGAGPGAIKCEMVICIDCGPAYELKWCPLPSSSAEDSVEEDFSRKLGLLSGTFEDGSFAVFAVPHPADIASTDHDASQPVLVKLPEPLLRIELEETCCWSIDWANSEVVAIGTTNGSIAVYDLGPSLKQMNADSTAVTNLLPAHYVTVHQAAIRALAWIRAPTNYATGEPCFEDDPMIIASGGYDGMVCMTNVRSGHGSVMNRTRDVINSMAYSPFGGGPVTLDHDNAVKAYSASPKMLGRGHMLVEPQGPVWSLSASDYHPQLAVGSADGTCTTTNLLRSTRRGGSVPFFAHRIYQMDYSRNTKELRMLEQFLPQETQDRGAANNPKNVKLRAPPGGELRGTGVWPREVGVQRVVWHSGAGLNGAGLLASATGSGLCRVDVLWGRWIREKSMKMPYGGIENIRLEGENTDAMDVDSEEGSD